MIQDTVAIQLPPIVPPKGRLTESEVRVAGFTSNNLLVLASMLAGCSGGGTVQTAGGTMKLSQIDAQAVISLLIERGENLLTQLDIALDSQGSSPCTN